MTIYNDNHFTPSDHNKITRSKPMSQIERESQRLSINEKNKFIPSDENKSSRKYTPIVNQPIQPSKHPIVNLCEAYTESVFFQLDSFPSTSGTIQFNNQKKGRIKKVTYFLDSSMNDNVTVYLFVVTANGGQQNLLNYVQGGNTYIKGTNNSMPLEFNVNIPIYAHDQIKIQYTNNSVQDCTIMMIANIKYEEVDF